jgi:hypothetical protein
MMLKSLAPLPLRPAPLPLGLVMLSLAFLCVAAKQAENHTVNGGFENATAGWAYRAVDAQASGEIDKTVHHSGAASFRMTHSSKFAPNSYSQIVQGVGGLKPNTAYAISVWSKGQSVGLAWIGGGPGWFNRTRLPEGDHDWIKTTGYYLTNPGETGFTLMVAVESPTKNLWIDDIEFVEAPRKTAEMLAARRRAEAERTTKLTVVPHQLEQRLAEMKEKGGQTNDAYVRLGLAVANRFLQRIDAKKDDDSWRLLQVEEIQKVLEETQRQMAIAARSPRPAARPSMAPAELRNGIFYVDGRPAYFNGYGHFDQVEKDLTNFPDLGVTIVQDGRVGPSAMNPDGSLLPNALQTIQTTREAAKQAIRVDFLASPHYFPKWAIDKYPDISNGNPNWFSMSCNHPKLREVIQQWLSTMLPKMAQSPALLTVCLSNEPTYQQSGRDASSKALWPAYLKKVHENVQALNALYGTQYARFEDVPVPPGGMPAKVEQQRAYYDWCRFNAGNWADFHAWMARIVKQYAPRAQTHAKIMVFFTFDRDKLGWGVDPELFCDATDLAGCDAYAFPGAADPWAYGWHGHEFFYDLLHSFRGQGVFNSENHLIPDGTPANHVPPEHTRSVLWQGALHHQAASTIWVWEEPSHPSLAGSIYFRPGNIYGAGQAMLDLQRFAPEVTAINNLKPRVALLYSPASIFWDAHYRDTIFSTYTQLSMLGEAVTFISEKQLAEDRAAKVDFLILPSASHVTRQTIVALSKRVTDGLKLIAIGDANLHFDEYHRPQTLPANLAKLAELKPQAQDADSARALGALLEQKGLKLMHAVDAKSNQPVWGIEYRVAEAGGATIVPMTNLTRTAQTVRLPQELAGDATDLLSGETISGEVKLEPMVPRLLRITKR